MEIPEKYCTIYVVRHGETEANLHEIVAGHFDSPLTEQGQKQAKSRAEGLKDTHFDAMFSSDLIRAKRTAEIIALDKKLAVNTTSLIRERFFGDWEGRPTKEVLEEDRKMIAWRNSLTNEQKWRSKINYGYESDEDISWRLTTFLREVAAAYIGKTICVVVHGSIMRALLMDLGFAKYDELPPGTIINTGYFVLQSDGVDFFIKETKGIKKKE